MDKLLDKIMKSKSIKELQSITRAMDRILMAGRYVIPIYHNGPSRIAHKSNLRYPLKIPLYGDRIGFFPDVWWKANQLTCIFPIILDRAAIMKLDIFSDPICPWCYIGKSYLDRALEKVGNHPFSIQWHPFQLNPEMPIEGGLIERSIQRQSLAVEIQLLRPTRPYQSMQNQLD